MPFVLVSLLAAPRAAAPPQTGSLSGRVLPSPDGRQMASRVWIRDFPAAVASDGSFVAANLPPGLAEIAVETPKGLYVISTPFLIAPAATERVHLALRDREDTSPKTPPEKEKKKKPGGIWANPATATLIIVGSAIVLGVAVDQLTHTENVPVSPSTN